METSGAVVVGYGYAGRDFHSYLINLTPGLELRGVVTRTREKHEKIKEEQECRAYDGLEEALDDPEVDLVVVATPSSTHAEVSLKALEAGKNVVTDKPMCMNIHECDRMIEAAQENGVLLTVFQNRRLDGDFLTVQKLMRDGQLGRTRWIEMAWQDFGQPGGWRGRAEMGGGRYWDFGAHLIDQLLLFFPEAVSSVYCRKHYDVPDSDVESHAMLVVGFDDGGTGVVDVSGQTYVSKPRFYVCGTEGTFVKYGLDPQEAAMCAGDIDAADEPEENYGQLHRGKGDVETIPTVPGRWRTFYENVAQALAGEAEPLVDIPSLRRTMAVLDAGLRSYESDSVMHPNIEALPGA